MSSKLIGENSRNRIIQTRGEKIFDICNHTFMVLFGFLTLYPFWYVLIQALNEGKDTARAPIYFWPRAFTLDNFERVIINPFIKQAFFVTLARTVIGPIFSLVVIALAAYALSKRKIPGRKFILYFYMLPMFIGGSVVSRYVVMASLKLTNNFWVYVLPYGFDFFSMVIMRTFIEQLPDSIEESAMLDGAGYMTIFVRFVLPLSKPIIATLLFFGVVFHWLDFGTNLIYVTKRQLFVLQYVMRQVVISNDVSAMNEMMRGIVRAKAQDTQTYTATSIQMATLVTITFPLLFVFPFFQRYFVKGIMVGAIKA